MRETLERVELAVEHPPHPRAAGLVQGAWRERPVLGRTVRLLATVTPLVVSLFVPWALAPSIARTLAPGVLPTLVLLVAISVTVYASTERLCRHLLPLGMLLGLSLGFPGAAPSRLRSAFGATSLRDAQRAALRPAEDRSAAEAAGEVVRLAAALGGHDRLTRGHVERVGAYADLIAAELGLGRDDRDRLRWAALLHDIGKLAVPAPVLNKTSPLTGAEWIQIRTHPAAGDALIEPLKEWLGVWGQAVVEHHERIDGWGYPAGLRGGEISQGARIVAVADAFDVMTSHRSYQRAVRPSVARRRLVACSDTQFDGEVVRAFLAVSSRKLAWAMGPISAIAQLPVFGQVSQLTSVVRAAPALTPIPTTAAAVGLLSVSLVDASAAEQTSSPVRSAPAVVEFVAGDAGELVNLGIDPAAPPTDIDDSERIDANSVGPVAEPPTRGEGPPGLGGEGPPGLGGEGPPGLGGEGPPGLGGEGPPGLGGEGPPLAEGEVLGPQALEVEVQAVLSPEESSTAPELDGEALGPPGLAGEGLPGLDQD